jgi:hypothetical protein
MRGSFHINIGEIDACFENRRIERHAFQRQHTVQNIRSKITAGGAFLWPRARRWRERRSWRARRIPLAAPHIVVPLLIAVGGIVWWFRRSGVRPDPPENDKGGSNGRATFNVQLVHHTAHGRRDAAARGASAWPPERCGVTSASGRDFACATIRCEGKAHGRQVIDRMDGCDLEPGDGLHEDQCRL